MLLPGPAVANGTLARVLLRPTADALLDGAATCGPPGGVALQAGAPAAVACNVTAR